MAGIPHERLIAYHNFHAWALHCVFVAHMVCMAVALRTRIDGQVIVRQLNDTVDSMQVNPRFGVAAFVLWSWVMVTSLSYFRRKNWGLFYAGHFVFLPAAVMTLLHTRCVASSTPKRLVRRLTPAHRVHEGRRTVRG